MKGDKCGFCGSIKGALIRLYQGWCCDPCFKKVILNESFTLFKFCQTCHSVLMWEVKQCPNCKNPRVSGTASQVWLHSKGLVDV